MKPKYRRMLKGMAATGPAEWSVYVVRCRDGSLYTGVAKNVASRLETHNSGKGAAYTRSRRPVELLSCAHGFTRSEALAREAWVKSLPPGRKVSALGLARPEAGGYNKNGYAKKKNESRRQAREARGQEAPLIGGA